MKNIDTIKINAPLFNQEELFLQEITDGDYELLAIDYLLSISYMEFKQSDELPLGNNIN